MLCFFPLYLSKIDLAFALKTLFYMFKIDKHILLSAFLYSTKPQVVEGVHYITSKRGTDHVLFEGNTFTPNEKTVDGQGCRSWKCSMYYKLKCKARITTRHVGGRDYLKPSLHAHNHLAMYPDNIIQL